MFQQEKPFLKPLPKEEFEYFKIGCRTVHADGHIEVRKSYYSVPYMYLGSRVTVHYNSKWVKVFVKENAVVTQIAFHRVVNPGRFQTQNHHLPEKKCFTTASYTKYLKEKCTHVGDGCERWATLALQEREQHGAGRRVRTFVTGFKGRGPSAERSPHPPFPVPVPVPVSVDEPSRFALFVSRFTCTTHVSRLAAASGGAGGARPTVRKLDCQRPHLDALRRWVARELNPEPSA